MKFKLGEHPSDFKPEPWPQPPPLRDEIARELTAGESAQLEQEWLDDQSDDSDYSTWATRQLFHARARLAEREAEIQRLRGALETAVAKLAHRFDCLTPVPTEEWAKKGSWEVVTCRCGIAELQAVLAAPREDPRNG